jgi:hypothetical protein
MMGRDRRYGRANLKTRVGIAAAVLVGGGAIGVAAVTATSHGPSSAASAGYSTRSWQSVNPANQLVNALNSWQNSNPYNSYRMLSSFPSQWMQTTKHGKTFAVQRGIVVLATNKFIILQSAQNGHLSLWLTSGNTHIFNVSNTMMGTGALIGNAGATTQAMVANNMVPATNVLVGSTQMARQMVAPAAATQMVKVVVAGTNLTVTVSITQTTATVQQTATTSWGTLPAWHPMTWTQTPWTTAARWTGLKRGDLALIAGFRQHGLLHAQIVLFTPLNKAMLGGTAAAGTGTTPTPVASSTVGVSGSHY